jgi:hypothetical protein
MSELVRVFSRSGHPIQTLTQWQLHASTKGKWADGFSAKELARLWLGGQGPAAVQAALEPVLPGLTFNEAVAEAQIAFDDYAGGVRNHDVLAFGTAQVGEVVVGVEGKVNESLDATLERKHEQATKRKEQGENSNLDKRVDELLDVIVGRPYDSPLAGLRYQLLSAIAGTAAAAGSSTRAAAVVVHLIKSSHANAKKFAETHQAVDDFCSALGLDAAVRPAGPLVLKKPHGEAPAGLPIWLAVIETAPG